MKGEGGEKQPAAIHSANASQFAIAKLLGTILEMRNYLPCLGVSIFCIH
jgi:hypothetical protein